MKSYLGALSMAAWFMLACCIQVTAQNLVPNHSFEVYSQCPDDFQPPGLPLICIPWQNGNGGSVDYFNICGTNGFGVPVNYIGNEPAQDGDAYTGLFTHTFGGGDYREYIQSLLVDPLVAGVTYHVSFYVSLADTTCAISHIGAYFSATPPAYSNNAYIDVTPQFDYPFGMMNQYTGWLLVSGCFVAEGGEVYITIGNFHPDSDTPVDPNCIWSITSSYYYIDNVSVEAGPEAEIIPFDIGDFVSSCPPYVIDPNVSGVGYTWSDGSHEPTLAVNESGVYTVTVTDGCNYGIDSVEVFIEGTFDQVDIGLSAITLCEGDVYIVSLDPQWIYVWSDGSTGPAYAITTPGTYSVIMDDGCDLSFDTITVDVLSPIAPFSLGIDTHLCPGFVIDYNFDPGLGNFHWQDNSNAASYTVSTDGAYALTISNACFQVSDAINVTSIPLPEVELGGDLYFCQGEMITVSVDPSQGNYVWEDGSTETDYTISSEGTYSVTVTNICGEASDNVFVNELITPPVDLGPDLTICPAQLPYTLESGDITDATYLQWQDGTNTDTYTVLASGTYSLIASNVCFTAEDVIVITVGDATPGVVLPADVMLCEGDSLLLTNAGSSGNYTWSDMSNADSLWIYAPGIYALTVTSACGSGFDAIQVEAVPDFIPPSLGQDFSICPGDTIELQFGNDALTYVWQDGSTFDSVAITSPGVYHVTVTDKCGASGSDTLLVTGSDDPPPLLLPDQINLCQGNSAVIESGVVGVDYEWNDGSQLSSITVYAPGTYILTISNSCGANVDSVVVLDGGPAPVVDLGGDVSFCNGDSYTLTPVFSNIDAWLWSTGSSAPSIQLTTPGEVSIQASNGCGSTADTIQVLLLPDVPLLSLGNDTVICPGDLIQLEILIPDVSIAWSDGSPSNAFTIAGEGNYYATISNSCGSSADSIRITALPAAPVLNLGADQLLCTGETIFIDPQLNGVSFSWHDGSTGSTFTTIQPGIITLQVSNSCGVDIDSMIITATTQGPQVDLGPDLLGCEGDMLTVSSGILGVDYLWQDGSTNPNFNTASSEVVILQVSNNCGVDSDTINTTFLTTPSPYLGMDTTLCESETIVLYTADTSNASYEWQDGSTLASFEVSVPGIYYVIEKNICGENADTIEVNYIDVPPAFFMGNDTSLCPGESVTLFAPFTTESYQWQDGSTAPSVVADETQIYFLAITNRCGSTRDEMSLVIDTFAPAIAIDPVVILCPDAVVSLDVTQPFAAFYLWSDGTTLSTLDVDTPGEYAVTVYTNCAETSQQVDVVMDDCFPDTYFYIPNAFSPNGDNVNDVFIISFNETAQVLGVTGSIYDRWGNLVYAGTDINFAWDGKSKGHSLNPGVYVYRIAITYSTLTMPNTKVITGNVTLVR